MPPTRTKAAGARPGGGADPHPSTGAEAALLGTVAAMQPPLADAGLLRDRVAALRAEVGRARLPLEVPGAGEAETHRVALLRQLDDYVLPRLDSLDAPLLAVVGGSTGAGKSTLVNSVLREEVSRPGVLRPTTTSPVLVHHPDDAHWFADTRVLPRLSRVTGSRDGDPGPGAVRLSSSTRLPAGLALLDAPDIDSVVTANRELAHQLLAAADLWLFVTTAARYADDVPWRLLREASDRGTAVAMVLDRVPPGALEEVRPHLAGMLREQGLGTAPVFTVPETTLTADGLLPEDEIGRLRSWLGALAGDARARAIVVRQTLQGALGSLDARCDELVAASRAQRAAAGELRSAAAAGYEDAARRVEDGISDGTLLRGEVLARWQEYVGTGEFFRKVESGVSRVRDRITAAVTGRPAPVEHVDEALQSGAAALVRAEADAGADAVARAWRLTPGGESLVAAHPELATSSPGLPDDVDRLVRAWQGEVLDLVRDEGRDRRTNARVAAYGLNGVGLLLMLVAFAHTGGALMGAEVGVAGGTAVVAQRVLEAIFGDQAVREMARRARALLLEHVRELYAGEQARYEDVLAQTLTEVTGDPGETLGDSSRESTGPLPGDGDQAERLTRAVAEVRAAR